jgi:MFS family permease
VYSTTAFAGGPALYGVLVSLISAGSIAGALYVSSLATLRGAHLLASGLVLSVALVVTALAPVLPVAVIGLTLIGWAVTSFTVGALARLQLNVTDDMSGRVMALFSVGFAGSKLFGGLLGGWLTDLSGPRTAFALGGLVVGLSVGVATLSRRRRLAHRTDQVTPTPADVADAAASAF